MGLKLDRDKFWTGYHSAFDRYGSTTQATVDALNGDLDKFETETRVHGIAQYSYILATEYHETGINGNHFVPVKEGRERAGAKGRANQDRYWKTGFYGRGKVQTTWEEKYLAVGKLCGVGDMFVKNPDLLLENDWAYEAMVAGMTHGIYRKDSKGPFSLDRMLKGDHATLRQYEDARQIINGDEAKNGALIAGYALHFEQILNDSAASPKGVASSPTEDGDGGTPTVPVPPSTEQPPITHTETLAVEETTQPDGSITKTVMAKADELGDKFQGLQSTLDKFGFSDPDAARSKWTIIITLGKLALAPFVFIAGLYMNYPEYAVPVTVLLIVGALVIWDRSGKRVAEAKAGVPVEVAKEMLKQ